MQLDRLVLTSSSHCFQDSFLNAPCSSYEISLLIVIIKHQSTMTTYAEMVRCAERPHSNTYKKLSKQYSDSWSEYRHYSRSSAYARPAKRMRKTTTTAHSTFSTSPILSSFVSSTMSTTFPISSISFSLASANFYSREFEPANRSI